ncbi:GIY-YIG nuclease family protein [Chloroflexi bacterium CFX6]|nr:GIY-YIG nuclease family protein [Chloroflexi bacterium CFX6]
MTKCYCYIVECADGTYYTGWAIDPAKRVEVHNKGRGARYTRTRLPVKLVYVEEQPDRKTAMKREMAIKRLGREGKMKLARVGSGQVGKYTSRQVNK